MKVYELMAFLAKQRADADVVVHGDGLLSSEIREVTDREAGPEMVHMTIAPEYIEEVE